MTVSELREKLNEYPQDMPVIAQWEGTWNHFTPESFRLGRHMYCHADDVCDVLIIDVEG